jgi:stage V sporulation protein G
MEITEVRIFLRESANSRLRAFATVTFDNDFVVRNIKVIEGNKGLFVAMPSRRVESACGKCGAKNPLKNKYCGQCGANLLSSGDKDTAAEHDKLEPREQQQDIAHPINTKFREYIQKKILDAYEAEKSKAAKPGPPQAPIPGEAEIPPEAQI